MNKPSFIICGTQKGGTKALIDYLNQHPNAFAFNKEINYFTWNYRKKSFNWYLKHFPEKRTCGEKSPSYMYSPEAPIRIFTHLPDVKLIFLLRDPVERAYSHYWMNFRHGYERRTFSQAIREPEKETEYGTFNYITCGFYDKQINRFKLFFHESQIHVEFSNDLKSDTRNTLNRVSKYLELRPFNYKMGIYSKIGKVPKQGLLFKILRIKPLWGIPSIHRKLALLNMKDERYPPIKEEDKEYLEEIYDKTKMQLRVAS